VHSFRATPTPDNQDWVVATTEYGRDFVSVVEKGNISATQFHPEKSGGAGLDVLRSFLEAGTPSESLYQSPNSNGAPCCAS
jgi:glutamine amidotransferase/cyclase